MSTDSQNSRALELLLDIRYKTSHLSGIGQWLFREAARFGPEIYWSIEPTNICNAKCVFCTYPKKRIRKNTLNEEHFKRFIKWAQRERIHKLQFTPVTGEAFLDPNIVHKLQFASTSGFSSFLFTNGSLLHRFSIEKILSCNIQEILISFGGFDRQSYHESFGVDLYSTVLENIAHLLKEIEKRKNLRRSVPDVTIFLRSVRKLSDELRSSDYLQYIEQYINTGICKIQHSRYYDSIGGSIADLPGHMRIAPSVRLLWLKSQFPCWYLDVIGLGSDGSIRLCNCVMSEDAQGRSDLRVGHIDDRFSIIKSNAKKLIQNWKAGLLPSSCERCQNYHPSP